MSDLTKKEQLHIIKTRDPRYDGRFFFGVKTTKIYCRPTCPARPKIENIILFKSSAEAEVKNYRACKRCKPDFAPGQKASNIQDVHIARALELIESDIELQNVDVLANALKVSSRHLRRIFKDNLGATPTDVINTQRLHLSKKFLISNQQKIVDIAFAVGFNSLRRFNDLFRKTYKVSPTQFRKNFEQDLVKNDYILCTQKVRAPYDWAYVLNYLDKHRIVGSEFVDDNSFTRYLLNSDQKLSKIQVYFDKKQNQLQYQFYGFNLKEIRDLLPKLNRLFDVKHNPNYLPHGASTDIRVPTNFNEFEVAITIILSQLISTKHAELKTKQLVSTYGTQVTNTYDSKTKVLLFPSPDTLKTAKIEELKIPKNKANAIRELSKYISENRIQLNTSCDLQHTKESLKAIKGIGPWTVELIAMRCLGDANAFPKTDLFVKRALDAKKIKPESFLGFKSYLCHLVWRDFSKELSHVVS